MTEEQRIAESDKRYAEVLESYDLRTSVVEYTNLINFINDKLK